MVLLLEFSWYRYAKHPFFKSFLVNFEPTCANSMLSSKNWALRMLLESVVGSNPTWESSSFFLGKKVYFILWEKRAVLGIVDLFALPLPIYLF